MIDQHLATDGILGADCPIMVDFRWHPEDAAAVTITFSSDLAPEPAVVWLVSREVLAERAPGLGDFRADRQGHRLHLALNSPAGRAVVSVPARPVTTWLQQIAATHPYGTESYNIDSVLDRIFTEAE